MLNLEVYMLVMRLHFSDISFGNTGWQYSSAIEKINEWLGKPVVITCDEVTAVQLPQVIECACHTTGVESVVFKTRLDEMRSDCNRSVQSGYHSYAGSPAVWGASGTTFLNRITGIPCFSGSEQEKDTVWFEQWLYSTSDARKHFSEQLVWAAINELCGGDAADAIWCLTTWCNLRWDNWKI